MVVLSRNSIKKYALNGMVIPFDQALLGGSSLDIRVGYTMDVLVSRGKFKRVDLKLFSKENPFAIMPETKVLVATLETFTIPGNVCGQIFLKSSRAREFWNHMHATFIDAGLTNATLTLELKNENNVPLFIYPGLRIGQVKFEFQDEDSGDYYRKHGSYNNKQEVTQSVRSHEVMNPGEEEPEIFQQPTAISNSIPQDEGMNVSIPKETDRAISIPFDISPVKPGQVDLRQLFTDRTRYLIERGEIRVESPDNNQKE